ncbi:mucin-associated surface protein (MASP), partial [Trypanosoma cruzi]
MMMTMTGRVLLVCALCVLWCGAGGGVRAETPQGFSGNPSEKGTKNDNATSVRAGKGDQSGQKAEPQETSPTGSGSPEAAPGPSPAPKPGGEASDPTNTTTESTDQKQEEKKEQKNEEAKDGEEDEEEEEEEEEEGEEEEEEGEEEDGAKENGETKKEETDTGTTERTLAGGQEQPSLSSAAEGASNITNPNSTPTTGDGDSAADGAGTAEGKQNENKDAN